MRNHGDCPSLSRREAIAAIGVGAAGLAGLGAGARAHAASVAGAGRATGSLRMIHMTDMHVQPERLAYEGLLACIRHAAGQSPDIIITGGDLIMDGFEATEQRTREQWDLFLRAWKDAGYAGDVRHTLGNHDIWGWNKKKSETRGDEARWGKRWALENLGMESAWHAFNKGAWRFVILDSVQPDGDTGYIGRLEDEQFEWLKADLAANRDRPTCVVSHISIVSATPLIDMKDKPREGWKVSGGLMLTDMARVVKLFGENPQVKVALSGHMHRNERLDYRGVSYICDGAVSGNWWKGSHHECNEGYGLLDLNEDGTFGYRYMNYGWKAEA
ncbi:MAG: metallophosphoesterase [Phycisphaeraceae bacterium]|nr:metallophosphoesterase [Phycisphaeraceae bacterium]